MSDIQLVEAPPGVEGAGFFATSLDKVIGIARSNSLWPLPFATSCCGIEFMATMASHYDLSRFGAERLSFSPRQADLLMVMGTIAKKMGPVLRQVYLQMAEPRWVMAVGACASSGGIFDTYSVLQGIDEVIRNSVMGKITNEELLTKINGKFDQQITVVGEPYGLLTIETSREQIIDLLAYLKNDATLQFIYLTDLTAIHYPEQEKQIVIVYHLHSLVNNVRIRIKVLLSDGDVHIPTATTVWHGANWMERETYDFFGVIFDGHPDLRRILNVDDMTAFPMRKEFPLEDPNRVDKKDYFFGR
jgi:NADH-quinone oxidoreductase subunit C